MLSYRNPGRPNVKKLYWFYIIKYCVINMNKHFIILLLARYMQNPETTKMIYNVQVFQSAI